MTKRTLFLGRTNGWHWALLLLLCVAGRGAQAYDMVCPVAVSSPLTTSSIDINYNFGTVVATAATDGTMLGVPFTYPLNINCIGIPDRRYALVQFAGNGLSAVYGPQSNAKKFLGSSAPFGIVTTTGDGKIISSNTNTSQGGNHDVTILSGVGQAASKQQQITFQLIKLGSTAITPGTYQTLMYMASHALYLTRRSEAEIMMENFGTNGDYNASGLRFVGQVTFTAPTCTVSTPDLIVNLDSANSAQLNTQGAVAGAKNFTISLVCQGGMTLITKFLDNAAMGNSSDVLTNTEAATQAGVGLQIVRNGTAVNFNTNMTVATVATDGTPVNIDLQAQYVRLNAAVTAGSVKGSFTYTLTYQ